MPVKQVTNPHARVVLPRSASTTVHAGVPASHIAEKQAVARAPTAKPIMTRAVEVKPPLATAAPAAAAVVSPPVALALPVGAVSLHVHAYDVYGGDLGKVS